MLDTNFNPLDTGVSPTNLKNFTDLYLKWLNLFIFYLFC
jgi:hypothetical protein